MFPEPTKAGPSSCIPEPVAKDLLKGSSSIFDSNSRSVVLQQRNPVGTQLILTTMDPETELHGLATRRAELDGQATRPSWTVQATRRGHAEVDTSGEPPASKQARRDAVAEHQRRFDELLRKATVVLGAEKK